MQKKIVPGIVCSLIGALFIFSGYSKLYPIEPFEYTFVDLGLISWQVAPFIARFAIALEFFIGILFLSNLLLRKLGYKLAISTLILFSAYLLLLIATTGNEGDCGCFGSYISMTPLQALIKNILLLSVLFILYKKYDGLDLNKKRYKTISLVFLGSVSLSCPFIVNPIELNYSETYLHKPENNFILPLDSLYNHALLNTPPRTLSKGKHLLAFLSLGCGHCKIAATKLRIIHKKAPEIPIYLVLNGDESDLKPFFAETLSESIPHCMLLGYNFMILAGTRLPAIYLINNSTVEHQVNYINLNEEELKQWLSNP